ncbi:MAG: hypothetical protein WAV18_11890, partial [Roseiarcus sp.]
PGPSSHQEETPTTSKSEINSTRYPRTMLTEQGEHPLQQARKRFQIGDAFGMARLRRREMSGTLAVKTGLEFLRDCDVIQRVEWSVHASSPWLTGLLVG